ncbi:MAG: hypothetical protein HYR85_19000 [Planctomycetes bacterium]|nr:hypothetical protein [Planctomycetota bacterium]MBI3847322.1 hypothetical protein [Planctomycetota bacterium]
MSCPDAQDANLVLRLYELRRESVLREARDWFIQRFNPQSFEQFVEQCPMGSDQNRMFRMVTSYWEMVGAFLNNGVLNADLYFQTTGEHLVTWLKVEPFVPKMRQTFNMPHMLKNLEEMAKKHMAWMDARTPGSSENFRAFARSIAERSPKTR